MGAVVKASYSSGGKASGKSGGSSLQYFSQRPDYEGNCADREIVTRDGVYQFSQDREALEQKIDAQEPKYLYRMVLSSGDDTMTQRQTELWAQRTLEAQNIHNYMLVAHAGNQGHTGHPHVHVLIPASEVFNKQQLNDLREAADQQYKIHQAQQQERQKLITVPDEASQQIKRSGGGKDTEMESSKPARRRENDYQWGR